MKLDLSNKWVFGISSIPISLITALLFASLPGYLWIIGLILILGSIEVFYNRVILRKVSLRFSAMVTLSIWLLIQVFLIAVIMSVLYLGNS